MSNLDQRIKKFAEWCYLEVVAPPPHSSARWILRADPNDPDWRDSLAFAERCLQGRATVTAIKLGQATTDCGKAATVWGLTVSPKVSLATEGFWAN